MDSRESELLWAFLESRLKGAAEALAYECLSDIQWPADIEGPLLDYSEAKTESALLNIARACAKARYFSVPRHVFLVAVLLERDEINIRDALSLLSSLPADRGGHNAHIQRVFDVVWHINEDEKDGLMKADGDSLLSSALHQILI
jgi:hypothetical protein